MHIKTIFQAIICCINVFVFCSLGYGVFEEGEYIIGFEPSEPITYELNAKFGGMITNSPCQVLSGRGSLLGDTRKGKGHWREFFGTNPHRIPIKNMKRGGVYSVEFDYKILEISSPNFFYLFLKDKGHRTLMRWTAAPGKRGKRGIEEYDKWTVIPNKRGHISKVFVAYRETPWELHIGSYGGGVIVIDNFRIRQWDNVAHAQEVLAAERLTANKIKQYASFLRRELIGIVRNEPSRLKARKAQIASQLKRLTNFAETDSGSINLSVKLNWKKMLENIRRELFRLKVAIYSQEFIGTNYEPAFTVFVENSLRKVRCDAEYPYEGKLQKVISVSAAKNEYESFQLVVTPIRVDLKDVSVNITNLRNGESVIPAKEISWHPVGYVRTTKPAYPVAYFGLRADPLLKEKPISVPLSQYVQPFWITVHVPSDVKAGLYAGKIRIRTSAGNWESDLHVRVWNFELPKRSQFRTAFGSWDSRYGKDSKRIRDAKKHLLRYRISPMRFGDAQIIMKQNGDIYLDFSQIGPVLDKYISCGLNGFTFGPYWGGWRGRKVQKVQVLMEESNKFETIELAVGGDRFAQFMKSYFRQWAAYLRKKNLMKMAYCYIYDEPNVQETKSVNRLLKILHEADPELKAVIPGIPAKGRGGDLFPNLKIMCPILNDFDYEFAKRMQQKGKESWCYICISPRSPYPNFFTDYPALAHRILFWIAWKYDIEGLLYWQTIFWRLGNPWENPETYPTVNGDGCLLYPDPNNSEKVTNSIRLEIIRDGIEDYDYFAILKSLVNCAEDNKVDVNNRLIGRARELLSIPEEIVATKSRYTLSPRKLLLYREHLGNIIEKLNVLRMYK